MTFNRAVAVIAWTFAAIIFFPRTWMEAVYFILGFFVGAYAEDSMVSWARKKAVPEDSEDE